jgi:hypothetical protein
MIRHRPRPRLLLPFLGLVVLLGGCALPSLPGQTRGPQILPDAQQIYRPLDAGAKNGDLESLDPA